MEMEDGSGSRSPHRARHLPTPGVPAPPSRGRSRGRGGSQPRPQPHEGREFPSRPPLLPGEAHGARAPRVAPGDRARARAHPKSSSMDLK